jgi:predicted aspartyl protease
MQKLFFSSAIILAVLGTASIETSLIFEISLGAGLAFSQSKTGRAKTTTYTSNSGCFFRGANGRTTDLTALCGVAKPSSSSPDVFLSPIKRRKGRTPVIDVTFESANGRQTFEMILDTGASGTVITLPMAQALGIYQVGETRVNTASERGVKIPVGYAPSIEVANITAKNVLVAIQPALDIGLLGHDFFGELEITVKRDVVEFRIPK